MAETVPANFVQAALRILTTRQQAEPVDALLALGTVAVESTFRRNFGSVPADATVTELIVGTIFVAGAQDPALGVYADLVSRTIAIMQAFGVRLFPIDTDEILTSLIRRAVGIAAAQDCAYAIYADIRRSAVLGGLAGVVWTGHTNVVHAEH